MAVVEGILAWWCLCGMGGMPLLVGFGPRVLIWEAGSSRI